MTLERWIGMDKPPNFKSLSRAFLVTCLAVGLFCGLIFLMVESIMLFSAHLFGGLVILIPLLIWWLIWAVR